MPIWRWNLCDGRRSSKSTPASLDGLVPAIDAALAVLDVLGPQHLVEGVAHRHVLVHDLAGLEHVHREERLDQLVLGVLVLLVAALEPGREVASAAFDDTSPPNRSSDERDTTG
jgi:hypothetical protein